MLFLFVFLLLCLSDFLFIDGTIICTLYILYLILFLFKRNKINLVSSFNSRFLLKSFFIKSLNRAFYLYLIPSPYLRVIRLKKQLGWKPLFKKSSYFGLYRAIRNQYINK